MALKSHGITADTPRLLLFSAGTVYKNLTYNAAETYTITTDTDVVAGKTYYTRGGTEPDYTYTAVTTPVVGDIATYYEKTDAGWGGTVLGATSGGSKLTITPEYVDPELDGATVAVRGAKIKVSEAATLESSIAEVKESIVKDSLHLVEDTGTTITGYTQYITKRSIEDTDYLDNIGFVGTLVSGEQVIVILPNAICTSAFELDSKNKTQATYKVTFECTATFAQTDLEHLPIRVIFPTAA